MGFVKDLDQFDLPHPDQKTIQINVVKSGIRHQDGRVEYTVVYPIVDATTHSSSANNNTQAAEQDVEAQPHSKQKVRYKSVDQLSSITIFQREIISYTVYDPYLNDYFGHDDQYGDKG